MKPTAALTAVIMATLSAACDSGPKVDVKDANASEVGDAVRESGIAGNDAFQVRPGKWESKVAILEMDFPDMPPGMQESMKKTIAAHQPSGFTSCLTPEQARKPKEDFFAGKDNNCRYDHFKMGDGKIDAKMRCATGPAVQVMEMAGSYSPDSYTMTVTSTRDGGAGPGGVAKMKMRMDATRLGACDTADKGKAS
jgi:hypothetical protein